MLKCVCLTLVLSIVVFIVFCSVPGNKENIDDTTRLLMARYANERNAGSFADAGIDLKTSWNYGPAVTAGKKNLSKKMILLRLVFND